MFGRGLWGQKYSLIHTLIFHLEGVCVWACQIFCVHAFQWVSSFAICTGIPHSDDVLF